MKTGDVYRIDCICEDHRMLRVRKFGNGAHLVVPKDWEDHEVLCILKKEDRK